MLRYNMPGNKAEAAGLTTDENGHLAQAEGPAELRLALLLLIATRPGERVERPGFGCPLDRLAFEPNDATTAGLAIRLVSDAIVRYEPRAMIDRLDAAPDPDNPAHLVIDLAYHDRRSGEAGQLSVPIHLGAGS